MLRADYQQYQGSGGSGGFGGSGFRDNQGFNNRREGFGNFGGGYRGGHNDGHQGGHFHQNKQFHHGQRKFDNYQQQVGFQGGYNPQQPRHYQNYGHQAGQHLHQQPQHSHQPGQHAIQPTHHMQPGQMPQSNYPSMNPQMTQAQQQMPGYQGYPNQGPQMYYSQGQMGNMPQRNPN
jgi:hypothetical protein